MSFLSLLFCLNYLFAQSYQGPVAHSMGQSGRAAVDPNESAYSNPASIAHLQSYYGSFNAEFRQLHAIRNGQEKRYGLLLADGTTENFVRGAIGFQILNRELPGNIVLNGRDWLVGFAGFPMQGLSFGLAYHRFESDITPGDLRINNNLHAGLIYTFSKDLGVALTVHDALTVEDYFRNRLITTYGLGINWLATDFFKIRADLSQPMWTEQNLTPKRMNAGLGLESSFSEYFIMRMGHFWRESEDEQYLSAGLGYKGPRLSCNYTIEQELREPTALAHMIDLWLPFW